MRACSFRCHTVFLYQATDDADTHFICLACVDGKNSHIDQKKSAYWNHQTHLHIGTNSYLLLCRWALWTRWKESWTNFTWCFLSSYSLEGTYKLFQSFLKLSKDSRCMPMILYFWKLLHLVKLIGCDEGNEEVYW